MQPVRARNTTTRYISHHLHGLLLLPIIPIKYLSLYTITNTCTIINPDAYTYTGPLARTSYLIPSYSSTTSPHPSHADHTILSFGSSPTGMSVPVSVSAGASASAAADNVHVLNILIAAWFGRLGSVMTNHVDAARYHICMSFLYHSVERECVYTECVPVACSGS